MHPPCFPPTVHDSAPPSLPRVPADAVPLLRRYYEVLRFPDVLPAALRFLRSTVTTPCACLRRSYQVRRRPGAGGFGSGTSPRRQYIKRWRRQGVPSSWGTLLCLRPALGPRRGPTLPGHYGSVGTAPRAFNYEGSPREVISGLNHTASALAVYASPGGSPHQDARLASGCWPALPDGIGYPQGSYERFPRCFLHRFPLSQASWRNECPPDPRGHAELLSANQPSMTPISIGSLAFGVRRFPPLSFVSSFPFGTVARRCSINRRDTTYPMPFKKSGAVQLPIGFIFQEIPICC